MQHTMKSLGKQRTGGLSVILWLFSTCLPGTVSAAPPSAAFLERPEIIRLALRLAGKSAQELEPALVRALRYSELEIQFMERANQTRATSSLVEGITARRLISSLSQTQASEFRFDLIGLARTEIQQIGTGLSAEFELLSRTYLQERGLSYPGRLLRRLQAERGNSSIEAATVMDRVWIERISLADDLEELALRHPGASSLIRQELQRAASQIKASQKELSHYFRFRSRLDLEDFTPAVHEVRLFDYSAIVRGQMGELTALLKEPMAVARGVPSASLSHYLPSSVAGNRARQALTRLAETEPATFSGEIDIVTEGLRSLIEVKNYTTPIRFGSRDFSTVLTQAQRTQRMRDLLVADRDIAATLGDRGIELKIYLLGGIDEESTLALEGLGFTVVNGSAETAARVFPRLRSSSGGH